MSFENRTHLAENVESSVVKMLGDHGLHLERTGYEHNISSNLRSILRKIHNNPTVTFLRYFPDFFCKYKDDYFFIEFKAMDTPIKYDGRVFQLRKTSGIRDLTKENIGLVETSAINNYKTLSKIGVKILVIVYASYNKNKYLADWEDNLLTFYNDKVKIGDGDASFTPYTNIHLDKMKPLDQFFKDVFNIEIKKSDMEKLFGFLED